MELEFSRSLPGARVMVFESDDAFTHPGELFGIILRCRDCLRPTQPDMWRFNDGQYSFRLIQERLVFCPVKPEKSGDDSERSVSPFDRRGVRAFDIGAVRHLPVADRFEKFSTDFGSE